MFNCYFSILPGSFTILGAVPVWVVRAGEERTGPQEKVGPKTESRLFRL